MDLIAIDASDKIPALKRVCRVDGAGGYRRRVKREESDAFVSVGTDGFDVCGRGTEREELGDLDQRVVIVVGVR